MHVRREDCDVGRRAFRERAAGHAEDPRRVHRQQLDQPRQRHDAGVHEAIKAERHRGLEAGDPERRAIELDVLFVGVMRRVVGRDDVDAAVLQARQHRVAIGRLAQRRIHLHVRVVGDRRPQHLVGEHEVVRRHLARDLRAARFAVADGVERLARAHVRDVHDALGQLGECDVAQRHDRFSFARNPAQSQRRRVKAFVRDAVALQRLLLAVLDDRHVEHARVLQRAPHQHRGRHRMPVVGQRDAAGLLELGDVRELFAFLAARDRADRIHARQVRVGGFRQDVAGDARVVIHRVRVRHARDGRETAGDGSRHAGRDRFLVLLPRLAQVHVHVDEPGTHDESVWDLDDRNPRIHREIAADACDAISVNQQVEHAVTAVRRIDHARSSQ